MGTTTDGNDWNEHEDDNEDDNDGGDEDIEHISQNNDDDDHHHLRRADNDDDSDDDDTDNIIENNGDYGDDVIRQMAHATTTTTTTAKGGWHVRSHFPNYDIGPPGSKKHRSSWLPPLSWRCSHCGEVGLSGGLSMSLSWPCRCERRTTDPLVAAIVWERRAP